MSDEVAECFAQVLSSECFFKYFAFHIQSYVDVVDTFVKKIQSWGDRSWETKAFKMIQDITLPTKFNILTDSIFRVSFVERFIGILVSLVNSLNVETSSTNLGVIVWKVRYFIDKALKNSISFY